MKIEITTTCAETVVIEDFKENWPSMDEQTTEIRLEYRKNDGRKMSAFLNEGQLNTLINVLNERREEMLLRRLDM